MKVILMAALACGVAGVALAQTTPGGHFVQNWDQNQDGAVSLEEAQSKRDDLFTAFDLDEDGFLSDEEYTAFDEMRAADQEIMRDEMGAMAGAMGAGQGMAQGNGQGMGNGQGTGNGQGMGDGQGMGMGMGQGMGHGPGGPEEGGMMRGFNDADGDGRVSRQEFTGKTADWFAMMDRDGDGHVTEGDFGP